jgi:hypothetical protein
MPKIEELREEDRIRPISPQEAIFRLATRPPDDALAANTILSSSLAIPMAEEDTIGIECNNIIQHQLDKADLYLNKLPIRVGYASAVIDEGVITSVHLAASGRGYKTTPTVSVIDTKGVGAKNSIEMGSTYAHQFLFWKYGTSKYIRRVILESGGKGYTSDAMVEIKGDGNGTKIELGLSGVVSKVEIKDCGEGYTFAPLILLEGGGGSGANAVANINQEGQLQSITVLNSGRGYRVAPEVIIKIDNQEIYGKKLKAFKDSRHLASDDLLHAIRMNNLSITGAHHDDMQILAQKSMDNAGNNSENKD